MLVCASAHALPPLSAEPTCLESTAWQKMNRLPTALVALGANTLAITPGVGADTFEASQVNFATCSTRYCIYL